MLVAMWKKWWSRGQPGAEARLQVLMVCSGNICRSPTAEAVLRARLAAAGLETMVAVDSAGTQDYHRGAPPDPRAVARAAARGYDLLPLRARPLVSADFHRFDLLLGMDQGHLDLMRRRCPPGQHDRLGLLLHYAPGLAEADEVPDPYYGSLAGFDRVLDLVEPACDGLVSALQARLAARA